MWKPSRWLAILLVLGLVLSGCAARKWTAPLRKSTDLAWPPSPHEPKAVYVGSLERFVPEGRSFLSLLVGTDDRGRLGNPVAVAVGLDDRLAVVDAMRQGVHLFVPAVHRYRFLSRTDEVAFDTPVSVAFDENLFLYVADAALKKVFVFDADANLVRQISRAGRDPFGKPGAAPLSRPTGLAVHDGTVYVVDTGDHRVHGYDTSGRYRFSFGGRGIEDGRFNLPTHVAVDAAGRVYVNDAMNFRIQVFDGNGTFLELFGRHGDGSGDFAMSKGIAVDRWGIVYVVDTLFDNIQLFDRKRRFVLTIGGRGTGEGEFWLPSGIFIDHNDKLYVCDTYNHRIQIFQLFDKQDVLSDF